MNHDREDQPGIDEDSPADAVTPRDNDTRREPQFGGFEEDDDYEEPDRDTDYASGYGEDNIDEDELDDLFPDDDLFNEDEPLQEDTDPLSQDPDTTQSSPENLDYREESLEQPAGEEPATTPVWNDPEPEDTGLEADTWLDDEDYPEENEDGGHPLPMGLIAVAILAVVLLVAGGYGVMQQRGDTQEEIRQLRAALATTASSEDVSASRSALQQMKERNAQLSSDLEALSRDNRRLTDTVAGLEAQLEAQQEALARQVSAKEETKPATAKPKPAPAKPIAKPTAKPAPARASAPSGNWFVNFGSYGQRSAAQAWSAKLRPESGKVIVSSAEKDGRTFYRVRVVGLPNETAAQSVARTLESDYGLSKLWVGKQ